ncbi:MAG: acetylornithine transaminase [Bacillota bacterium]|nr:acetylornithine transaminase [Bacillota bacterium]
MSVPEAGKEERPQAGGGDHLLPVYNRAPVALVRGEGAYVWDDEGRRYLDFAGGIAASVLGHAHPALVSAVADQAARLIHVSNLYEIPLQRRVAERLAELTGLDRFFFCNSGTEATEAAIKLARRWGHQRGVAEPEILTFEGCFHGRTLGSLAATGNPHYAEGFEPLPAGFRQLPWNEAGALAGAVTPSTVAVLLEVIQGEGGLREAAPGFLEAVQAVCRSEGLLLMVDEVQTGMGRTGSWFAYQAAGLEPDVVTLAKGLAGGVPVGAMGVREELAGVLAPGSHGSTFGGNPLAMAAALATLEAIAGQGLVERAREVGARLREGLEALAARHPSLLEVRGRGLMLGIRLAEPPAALIAALRERGLLAVAAAENVVRFLPPLVIGQSEVEAALAILEEALAEADGRLAASRAAAAEAGR